MEPRVSTIGECGLKPSLLHLDVNTKKPKSKFTKAPLSPSSEGHALHRFDFQTKPAEEVGGIITACKCHVIFVTDLLTCIAGFMCLQFKIQN